MEDLFYPALMLHYVIMGLIFIGFVVFLRYWFRHFKLWRSVTMKILTSHQDGPGPTRARVSAHHRRPYRLSSPNRPGGIMTTGAVFLFYFLARYLFDGLLLPDASMVLALLFMGLYGYHSLAGPGPLDRLLLVVFGFLGASAAMSYYGFITFTFGHTFHAWINLIAAYVLRLGVLVNLGLLVFTAFRGLSGRASGARGDSFDEYENAFHSYIDYILKMQKRGGHFGPMSPEERAKESGREGEANVRYHLKWLEGYKVLHNVRIPNPLEAQEIDHIVIGPNGIFHLETKNHGGKYGARIVINKEGDWSIVQHNGYMEGMTNPLFQVRRHERVLREFLEKEFPRLQLPVKEIVVLSNEKTILEGQENSPVTVLKVERLNDFIMSYQPGVVLDQKTVEAVYAKLAPLSQAAPA